MTEALSHRPGAEQSCDQYWFRGSLRAERFRGQGFIDFHLNKLIEAHESLVNP